jgi:hypothetical protein
MLFASYAAFSGLPSILLHLRPDFRTGMLAHLVARQLIARLMVQTDAAFDTWNAWNAWNAWHVVV